MNTSLHTGTVLWYDCVRGYGFVADHCTAKPIFITHTALEAIGVSDLNRGARIFFDVTTGKASCKVYKLHAVTPRTPVQ